MMATKISSQRPAVAAGRMSTRAIAQAACPSFKATASSLKSTAFVSGAAAIRAAQPAKLAVKCRSGAALTVAEISYIMIKPDGTPFSTCLYLDYLMIKILNY